MWLCEPDPVLPKHHIQVSKTDPLVNEVKLLQANPQYAHIRYPDGKEDIVSVRHLAPTRSEIGINPENETNSIPHSTESTDATPQEESASESSPSPQQLDHCAEAPALRRSSRLDVLPLVLKCYNC